MLNNKTVEDASSSDDEEKLYQRSRSVYRPSLQVAQVAPTNY
jgi:hypothetical protein